MYLFWYVLCIQEACPPPEGRARPTNHNVVAVHRDAESEAKSDPADPEMLGFTFIDRGPLRRSRRDTPRRSRQPRGPRSNPSAQLRTKGASFIDGNRVSHVLPYWVSVGSGPTGERSPRPLWHHQRRSWSVSGHRSERIW
jgi:hypothetical protein